MSGGYPLGSICNAQGAGTNVSGSLSTQLTAAGTANTKGSYAQLIASSSADAVFALITMQYSPAANPNAVAVDIAVGGAGSETVVVPNLLMEGITSSGNWQILIPLHIPAGTRIAARCQSSVASDICYVGMILFDGDFGLAEGPGGYDAIGFTSATTLGTAITPNASVNIKGSYSQLVASALQDYRGFFACFDMQNTAVTPYGPWVVDIAIGGAGSEVIIVPDLSVGPANQYGQFTASMA